MHRFVSAALAAALIAFPAFAIEPGQAEGSLTAAGEKIPLAFAYAIGRQRNEFNSRKDDIRIVVTNAALPDNADLATIENGFPDGIYGIVVSIDNKHAVSHVVANFASGMFDAGFFPPGEDYTFTGKVENKRVEGQLRSKTISTSWTKLSFDVKVNAAVK